MLTASISTVDVTLQVGLETQTVNVEASLPLLETETSAVAGMVENKSITYLPLVDRRSAQLQRLNGFVVQTNSGANATFAIAGGRSNNADYTVDGGTVQNLLIGVPTLIFDPPVESVQEFNVAISNYSAELGRSGGAVVQMTTKSGTNSFHGSAYEYLRNTVLQAQPEFATSNPILRYNLFGASLGGPIKKNKTQFFFNYEGRRQVVATPESLTVPNAQELTGNFNGIIDPKTGTQVVVKNPLTGQLFANNIIPTTSRIRWALSWRRSIRKISREPVPPASSWSTIPHRPSWMLMWRVLIMSLARKIASSGDSWHSRITRCRLPFFPLPRATHWDTCSTTTTTTHPAIGSTTPRPTRSMNFALPILAGNTSNIRRARIATLIPRPD